jgi:hypothetical protein
MQAEALRALVAMRARFFSDYANAWESMGLEYARTWERMCSPQLPIPTATDLLRLPERDAIRIA